MSNAFFKVPVPQNEPVKSYAPGSAERKSLKAQLSKYKSTKLDIPMVIGGKDVYTEDKRPMYPPHELEHLLGHYNYGRSYNVPKDVQVHVVDTWVFCPLYKHLYLRSPLECQALWIYIY